MIDDLLTLDEAAKLRICARTLREHIKAGRLAYISLGTGSTRQLRMIEPKALAEFVERQRRTEACPSTGQETQRPTSTTSSYEVVDFAALRIQRRDERRKRADRTKVARSNRNWEDEYG